MLYRSRYLLPIALALLGAFLTSACSTAEVRTIEATAYCGCGECNGYDRGSWIFLKADFWNKSLNYGAHKGEPYTGFTAAGTRLRTYNPGLFSIDSVKRPWMIPVRVVLFPWLLLPHDGTIAADTDYYPFGTRMYVEGYGWGVVEDVGGAIKGPNRIDLYHPTHRKANVWGRQNVIVEVILPG